MSKYRGMGALIAVVSVLACGDDALGPDVAQSEAFVFDDPAVGGASYSGTAAGNFQASLSADGQTWIDLGSLNGITVSLQVSPDEATVHGAQAIPEGTFTRVRLVLQDVEVTVSAGSTVGGVMFPQEMKADLASGVPLSIERVVPEFSVMDGERAEIRFDLNSESWLTANAVQNGLVPTADVEAAATASVIVSD